VTAIEVKDGEPPLAESDLAVDVVALVVGPPMTEDIA
jgi:hypothetical protein